MIYNSALNRNIKIKKPVPTTLLSGRPRLTNSRSKARKKNVFSKGMQSSLREAGNSAGNPIDIDAMFSLFEPSVLKEYVHILSSLTVSYSHFLSQVEKEEISFPRESAPIKIESTYDLHAFDADGMQMKFRVKAHVRSYGSLEG